jgi:hypothetical protein
MAFRRIAILATLAACGTDTVPGVPDGRHAEPRLRRLLAKQYTNSVKALLGEQAAEAAAPPADIPSQGFEAIGASQLSPSDSTLAQYESSARAIADVVVSDVSMLPPRMGCTPTGPTDQACFETFVRTFGKRAFRRPLTEDEVTRYVTLTSTVAGRYGNPYAGVAYAITAFLQSPNFIYQVEIGEIDPAHKTRRKLTGYEMATRLSFFLLDTPPDDAMLDLAETGLAERADIRTQAAALLEREEAKGALDNYFEERFKLRQLTSLTKDPALFPTFGVALAEAMRTESLMLLRDVAWTRDADVRELLDAPYAFVNADLAQLYGTAAVTGDGFEKRMLSGDRRGMFGQAAFLSSQAHPGTTSPTRRGRFISERALCIEVPPPPPEVVTELPPPVPGMPQTMRERLAEHASNEQCAGCHNRMDPIGLALENFDPIGAARTTDQGLPLDLSGEIFDVGTFTGLPGLTQLVREHDNYARCWVRSLYRHATGHIEAEADEEALQFVDDAFAKSQYKLKALLVEVVASDAFRFVDNAEVAP